jgi:cellulose synthase/poly-beta-1,6-N-acetylglucosamine synthase-like glycosyltransferase
VTVLAIIVALFCVGWIAQAVRIFRNLAQIRDLAELTPPDPASWPRVSTITPARNEAAGLADSLQSRLDDGYPELEIIVVDDRSEDRTPQIASGSASTSCQTGGSARSTRCTAGSTPRLASGCCSPTPTSS